ncbi:MAG: NAD(P)-dependent oxidoreductase [Candidatus Magasanikbacteria bacterium]|nr:NAD(P)-dependent oxidoreductase [Candidatus Magasanikbacteria bacterium]
MNDEPKKEKVFICGGAGYIGGYLTDLLVENGYDVTVYDNLVYETRFLKNVPFIYGDVRDQNKLAQHISQYDVVIWLAAIVGDSACAINKNLTSEINFHSVQWLTKNYSGKIIFMSTCSVYGVNNEISDESSLTNPLSHYAATKLEAEQEVVTNARHYLAFRLGTVFGVGDRYSRVRFDLVVNSLVKRAVMGQLLTVFGGGQWRPLLHVKDVAEAVLFGLKNNITGLYNLATINYKICDIAQEIERIIPHTRVEYVNTKFEDVRNYKVSAEKFIACGWQPKYDLTHGINEIQQILSEARLKDPHDAVYSNFDYLKNKIL